MADFAIIGMGRFGRAVARALVEDGQAVLCIDRDAERLSQVAEEVDATARADTTEESAVRALKLERMTGVVVAIGSRATEASILTVAILREVGVPRIVARAFDERHARLLLAIGASEVLNPEDEIGARLALRLARPSILDQFQLGDGTLAEVEVPEAWVGTPLAELDPRGRWGVVILAVRRGDDISINPGPESLLESGDVLVVLGEDEAVDKVAALR